MILSMTSKSLSFYSWNVNGIRAWHKKGASDFVFENKKPDFICLQEIKAEKEQLPEELAGPEGYYAYFNSSKTRKGYSGVAIYTKHEPEKVEYDLGIGSRGAPNNSFL